MHVDTHPVTTGETPAAAAPAAPAIPAATPVATRRQLDSATSPRAVAHDSSADNAALDSLEKVEPAASLPDVPIDAHPTWDLNVADFADQPRVKYYLDYFTGRAHDRFQIWLDRMARYEPYARAEFASRNLPGDFVYLALIESGFSPSAVSRTAAVGIWQFMPATGKLYGLQVDSWLDERRDPIKSTDAAAHHLDDLTQRFGSHYLAAAAYNAGAGRVQRGLGAMSTGASGDDSLDITSDDAFFSLADTRMIRDETKNYVPQLIAAAIIAKEPARYGFETVHDVATFPLDSVIVDGGTGLDLIARLADTTLDALRDLNPHLLRLVTPPTERYAVRVPAGTAEKVAAAYAALDPAARREVVAHQVRSGETVATLAREFSASPALIRSANRAARGRSLPAGTMLYIPVSVTAVTAAMMREPDPPRTTRTVTHTLIVRRGESIASVARRGGVSVKALRTQNHLAASAMLRSGERLVVHATVRSVAQRAPATHVAATKPKSTAPAAGSHGKAAPATRQHAAVVSRTHVVKRGETITAIAGQFGVRPSQLIAINGLGKDGHVQAGQTIKIPG
jgi:membrane-bound lytic murein transglycosylase D